ncbi:hypothetical protein PsYK624_008640 [Phanerochaete sordida]|uniref:Uncharacterized protein n=1 Tax=Phanerochaete sordida TaxID=48140 RepID=A0A9P3FY97_9APHY|nr:hypothetical protein PsYK624_008640 [Phanerochaete sordida]
MTISLLYPFPDVFLLLKEFATVDVGKPRRQHKGRNIRSMRLRKPRKSVLSPVQYIGTASVEQRPTRALRISMAGPETSSVLLSCHKSTRTSTFATKTSPKDLRVYNAGYLLSLSRRCSSGGFGPGKSHALSSMIRFFVVHPPRH